MLYYAGSANNRLRLGMTTPGPARMRIGRCWLEAWLGRASADVAARVIVSEAKLFGKRENRLKDNERLSSVWKQEGLPHYTAVTYTR